MSHKNCNMVSTVLALADMDFTGFVFGRRLKNMMKKSVIAILAVAVFVTAAFAAVSLEDARTLADVESALGAASSRGNDGTDYISYTSVPQSFIVSKWVRVNSPAYPTSFAPEGTIVSQGTPCTIRLNIEAIDGEEPGHTDITVRLSSLKTKEDWKGVAENGLLTDLNDGTNGFSLTLIKRVEIDGTNWTVSNGQPIPVGETADLGRVSVYPNKTNDDRPDNEVPGVISNFQQLNAYCQNGKGQIVESEFPFAWIFRPLGQPVKVDPQRMPTVKPSDELVAQDELLVVGTSYLVIDGDAFFSFKPTTLEEKKMLGISGYLDRAKEIKEGDNTVVAIEGLVARWQVPQGMTFQTESATLGAGEIAEQGTWGTLRGNYVAPRDPSEGEGGGGGGCNAGNFGLLGLLVPGAMILQRKRS